MLSHLLIDRGDIRSYVIGLLLSLPIVLLALSVHETAHGFAAYKLGDPTARSYGRLTLNPLKHLDPIGTVCMLLFGFGWARPVPINSRYFKKPRRDMAITALAGPVSNLLMALIFGLLFNVWLYLMLEVIPFNSALAVDMAWYFYVFLYYGVSLNVTLAVFNLLPVPPLDGSRIVSAFLPPKAAYAYIKYERIISLVLMVALFVGVLSPVISIASDFLMEKIFYVTGFWWELI
ncbi:MAG: site-2 protease family protein [Ruminococcaceae bacterium]|nr:site-2 protease family protein [Oscillospiraceae bacterium]